MKYLLLLLFLLMGWGCNQQIDYEPYDEETKAIVRKYLEVTEQEYKEYINTLQKLREYGYESRFYSLEFTIRSDLEDGYISVIELDEIKRIEERERQTVQVLRTLKEEK